MEVLFTQFHLKRCCSAKTFFFNNSAFWGELYACSVVSGVGGSIFVDLLSRNVNITSTSFSNNSAGWFGGAIGTFKLNNSLFNLNILRSSSYFASNQAEYGLDIGSSVNLLKIWTN
jgi:predicted outer membrane repeat protein